MTIADFIAARLDEDELWARLASQPPTDKDAEPEAGVHWQWITADEEYELVIPDPNSDGADGMLTPYGTLAWLATVEKFHGEADSDPSECGYSDGVHNMDGPAAAHIARHDPARVRAEVAAKRTLLEMVLADQNENGGKNSDRWNQVMRLLALPYRDHHDYRKSWAPR